MKIGIDVSQVAYSQTGVANYLVSLVNALLKKDTKNEYILFYSSFGRPFDKTIFEKKPNLTVKTYKVPLKLLEILWNKFHIFPIEQFIGNIDIFITSDWVEPPTKQAKKMTILYDLIVYLFPEESDKRIVKTQKEKLQWIKKESDAVICISESTKKDAEEILGIPKNKLFVVYPGV